MTTSRSMKITYFFISFFSISLLNFTELYNPWEKRYLEFMTNQCYILLVHQPGLGIIPATTSLNKRCLTGTPMNSSMQHNQALSSNVLVNQIKFHFIGFIGYGESAGAFQCRCALFYLQCESQPSPLGPEPLLRRTWSVWFSGAWTGSRAGCLPDREHYSSLHSCLRAGFAPCACLSMSPSPSYQRDLKSWVWMNKTW